MKFQKKEIVINGKKACYWEKNPLKKEAILFLHGFPGSHGGLLAMANAFDGYRLIVPDLPACGDSDSLDGKHNLENYSKWLECFLEKLKIANFILVGHSFGARVGLYFANNYPSTVDRLVFITPVVKVDGWIVRIASLNYKIAEYLPKALQQRWLGNPIYRTAGHMIVFKSACPKRKRELIARDEKEFNHLDPRATIELFEEFYSSDLVLLGKGIHKKTLVIAGEKDEVAPLNSVKKLVEELPDACMVIMRGEGHVVVAECPITTAGIIKKWLRENI